MLHHQCHRSWVDSTLENWVGVQTLAIVSWFLSLMLHCLLSLESLASTSAWFSLVALLLSFILELLACCYFCYYLQCHCRQTEFLAVRCMTVRLVFSMRWARRLLSMELLLLLLLFLLARFSNLCAIALAAALSNVAGYACNLLVINIWWSRTMKMLRLPVTRVFTCSLRSKIPSGAL